MPAPLSIQFNLILQKPLRLFNLGVFTVTQQCNYQFHFRWIIQLCTSAHSPQLPNALDYFYIWQKSNSTKNPINKKLKKKTFSILYAFQHRGFIVDLLLSVTDSTQNSNPW